jgi:hypothetical protein
VLLADKPDDVKPGPFDWAGLILLALWVVGLLICLFRGQKWGWTTSPRWTIACAVFVISFILWVLREINTAYPLIDLRLLGYRHFHFTLVVKSLFMINFGAVVTLLVHYMVETRGYPRTTTGLVLLPGGLAMGVALILSGLIGRAWSRKRRVLLGLLLLTIATWRLSVIDLYTDKWLIAADFIIWGFGAGLFMPPCIALTLETLPQPLVVSSAVLKNMVRVLPGTIGSLLINILIERRGDMYFDYLRQDIVPNRAVAENVREGLLDHLVMRGSSGPATPEQASHVIGQYIHQDATAFAGQTGLQYLAILMGIGFVIGLFIHSPKDEPSTG